MVNVEIERLPQENWITVRPMTACHLGCPQEGHSVRLEAPGVDSSGFYALGRVSVLHAVRQVREQMDMMVSERDLADGLMRLMSVGFGIEVRDVDISTYTQMREIRRMLAKRFARVLTYRLNKARRSRPYYYVPWAKPYSRIQNVT